MNCIQQTKPACRLVAGVLWASFPGVGTAQVSPDEAVSTSNVAPDEPSLIDRESLEAFLDPLVDRCLDKFHVPGVVVVVVQDGQMVIAKGYGYADVGKKIPVDPVTTLFRVASVSKPFTATAVMQLAARGLISLQDDVTVMPGEQDRAAFEPCWCMAAETDSATLRQPFWRLRVRSVS